MTNLLIISMIIKSIITKVISKFVIWIIKKSTGRPMKVVTITNNNGGTERFYAKNILGPSGKKCAGAIHFPFLKTIQISFYGPKPNEIQSTQEFPESRLYQAEYE